MLPLARSKQAAVAPGGAAQRVGRRDGEICPGGLDERTRRPRDAPDRERVPRREDLVVEAGPDPRLARREQRRLRRGEPRLRLRERYAQPRGHVGERLRDPQVPCVALEIRRPVETEVRGDERIVRGRQKRPHLIRGPHVELALLALAVGVEARVEAAVRRAHLARKPGDDAARDLGVARVAGDAREVGVESEERPVVVEHLLEVRDRPLSIGAVAAEAARQLVVDAAVGHPRQRVLGHAQRAGVTGQRVLAQAEREVRRMRELGRPAEAAVLRIVVPRERGERRSRCRRRQRR